MAFYLKIDQGQMWYGGDKSIQADHASISQTRSLSFISDDGSVSSPMGIWIIGSSVKANYVASRLRCMAMLHDDQLIKMANENDVQIFIYSNDRMYTYKGGHRGWVPVVDGYLFHVVGTDRSTASQAMADCNCSIPKGWSTTHTWYEHW